MRAGSSDTPIESGFGRTLVRWIMKAVGDPNISVRLWDGDEFPITDAQPVACMEFREQRALFERVYATVERGDWSPVEALAPNERRILEKYSLWPDLRAAWLRATTIRPVVSLSSLCTIPARGNSIDAGS